MQRSLIMFSTSQELFSENVKKNLSIWFSLFVHRYQWELSCYVQQEVHGVNVYPQYNFQSVT